MGFFKKKEEKKKFDYSEETKELFAERDAFYAEQRKRMGGETSNPELNNQDKSETSTSKEEDLENLLGGGGDFNPYVNTDESSSTDVESVSTPILPKSAPTSSAFVCVSCGKDFQEKWGKCPSCGGEMKKAEHSSPQVEQAAPEPSKSNQASNAGDPLDDLLGDFGSSDSTPAPSEEVSEGDSGIKMVDEDDLTSNFGESRSNHSNRKRVKKVRKVKRARKLP